MGSGGGAEGEVVSEAEIERRHGTLEAVRVAGLCVGSMARIWALEARLNRVRLVGTRCLEI